MNINNTSPVHLFSGEANRPLAENIARELKCPLSSMEFGRHPDGEQWLWFEPSVRGADVFLIQPLSPPVDEHLVQLMLMGDAVYSGSASRITFVIPYLGYQRQDRKAESHTPMSARVVIRSALEAAAGGGVSLRSLVLDLHSEQLENIFREYGQFDHLRARPILAPHYREKFSEQLDELVVASTDAGGVKGAEKFSRAIGASSVAFIHKQRRDARTQGGGTTAVTLGGDVSGKDVLFVDDLISTAGSLASGAELVKQHGAKRVYACATHGVFAGNGPENIRDSCIDEVCVTDSILVTADDIARSGNKIRVISVAPLLAKAIEAVYSNKSVSSLFE